MDRGCLAYRHASDRCYDRSIEQWIECLICDHCQSPTFWIESEKASTARDYFQVHPSGRNVEGESKVQFKTRIQKQRINLQIVI